MDIKNKKAQGFGEFMMTYGWAIFASIIAISVLAYFGVFNPDTFRNPNPYESSDTFYCIEWDGFFSRDRLLLNCYDFDEENFDCVWEISDKNELFVWKPREKIRDIGELNELSEVELLQKMNCTTAIRI